MSAHFRMSHICRITMQCQRFFCIQNFFHRLIHCRRRLYARIANGKIKYILRAVNRSHFFTFFKNITDANR